MLRLWSQELLDRELLQLSAKSVSFAKAGHIKQTVSDNLVSLEPSVVHDLNHF